MSSHPVLMVLLACFAVALVWAAWQDLWARRIPNYVTLAIAATAPLAWLVAGLPGSWWGVPLAVGATLGIGSLFFGAGYFGGGDVKLATAIMLWAGTAHGLEFLLISAVAGGVLALLYVLRPNVFLIVPGLQTGVLVDGVPYGVALAAGGLWVGHRLLTG